MLSSCTTTQPIKNNVPRIAPPDPYGEDGKLAFYYIAAGETVTPEEDAVLLKYWYFEKIYDYIVDTQAAQEIANKTTAKK